jgi:YesN/AraC family two-component response regulator
MMPKMNGFELCRAIKLDINISHIPVILLTVLDANENKIEGFDEGADDYLNKPLDVDLLIARIKNIINTREALKQRYLTEPDPDVKCLAHSNADRKFILKANEIMQNNLSAIEFTAEDFAREIGMSRSNLHIKMRALANQSTTEFIRTYRLKEAVKLLSTKDYNVSEVAYMVGFNTISYFNRCFKKMYSITPSEYVENLFNFKKI